MSELIEAYWMHFVGGMIGGFVTRWLCRRISRSTRWPWNGELSDSSTYDGPIEIKGVIDRRDPPRPVPGDKYAYTEKFYRPRRFLWPKLVAVNHVRFNADGARYSERALDLRRCRIVRSVTADDVQMRRPGTLKCWFHKDGCDALKTAQRRAEAKGLA